MASERIIWCALGAVLAHMSVNLLNEYVDFKSGLDLHTKRTPFSGGSGSLVDAPEQARAVLIAGLSSLSGCVIIGFLLLSQVGWPLLPVGVLGIVLVLTYTPWLNRNPLLCLVAPGLGFGTAMVVGTFLCVVGQVTWEVFYVSFLPFFAINNLLLLNQFPDARMDKQYGRHHGVIAYGFSASASLYVVMNSAALAILLLLILADVLPDASMLLVPLFLLPFLAARGAFAHQSHLGRHPAYMAFNIVFSLTLPLLLSVILMFLSI